MQITQGSRKRKSTTEGTASAKVLGWEVPALSRHSKGPNVAGKSEGYVVQEAPRSRSRPRSRLFRALQVITGHWLSLWVRWSQLLGEL
jgi:hypothetical protein